MRVERTNNEILIRIPSTLDTNRLQSILDLIRYGELTAMSTGTQKEADKLASEANRTWWRKNKDRFIK